MAYGTPQEIMEHPTSLSGQYLSGSMEVAVPAEQRRIDRKKRLRVIGARGNNLKNVTADIPIGTFTCVTGVSGGGKSTF